jgi:hypothetical protein
MFERGSTICLNVSAGANSLFDNSVALRNAHADRNEGRSLSLSRRQKVDGPLQRRYAATIAATARAAAQAFKGKRFHSNEAQWWPLARRLVRY